MPTVLRFRAPNFFVQFPAPTREREPVRAAGFRFDAGSASWKTTDIDVVANLIKSTTVQVTEEAAAAIIVASTEAETRKRDAQKSLSASFAVAADIAVPAPTGLSYLPYQLAGIAFGMSRDNTLIADDMGLGKTIQAIGIVNGDPNVRRVLIVCPASLKINWLREFSKWDVKGLTIGIAKGGKLPATDVVVVNFEIVSKLRGEIDGVKWDVLIVDEAHYIKNQKAQRTLAILGGGKKRAKPIVARRRVFLTGTPIVNRPSELWPLVRSLDPNGLGSMGWFGFARRYCGGHDTRFGFEADGATNLDELQTRLRSSIMIRRLKKDVLTDLPAKRRQLIPMEPNAEVRKLLRTMEKAEADTKARIAKLRAEARQAGEGTDTYKLIASQIRQAAQISFEEMSKHRHELAIAKAPSVVEHVREVLENEDSVVIACHHRDVAELMQRELHVHGVHMITGGETQEQRQAAKDAFMSGKGRIVIGTIGAMAEGWTLTRASTMIFAELDWTPGKVSQTEDRIHRIGQQNAVLIQHLVVDGSLDARFVETLVNKQQIIESALNESADAVVEDREKLAASFFEVADFDIAATTTEEEAEKAFESDLEAYWDAKEDELERRNEAEYARSEERRKRLEERHAKVLKLLDGVSPEAVAAAYEAVAYVASLDEDHALEENEVGFSTADTTLGHRIATLPHADRDHLTDAYAVRLARTYRRQVTEFVSRQAAHANSTTNGAISVRGSGSSTAPLELWLENMAA